MKKRLFLALLLLAFGFSQTAALFAQTNAAEAENDLVISIAGYDDLRKSILTVANKMNPTVGMAAATMMNPANNPMIPKGIAKTGPLGVVMRVENGEEMFGNFLAFLPVTKSFDVDAVKEHSKTADVKIVGGQAVITFPTTKIELPEDPAALLGTLPSRYVAAVRMNPSKFAFTEVPFLPIDMLTPAVLDNLRQTDDLVLGANVDATTGEISLEYTSRAKAGTALADDLKNRQKVTTNLAGFYDPDAFVGFHAALVLPESIKKSAMDGISDQPEGGLLKVLFQQVLDAGKFDFAFSYSTDGGWGKTVIAVAISDGPALQQIFQDTIRDMETTEAWKFNAAEAMPNVFIHTYTTKDDFTGSEFITAVAVSETYLFFAFNHDDNVAVLKEKIATTLEATALAADFRGHIRAMPDENLAHLPGTLTFSGSLTETGMEMNMTIPADFIMSTAIGYMQLMTFGGMRPTPMPSAGEWNRPSPESDVVGEAFRPLFNGWNGYSIRGNEITLRITKDTPAEEVDAVVEKIKEKLPEMNVKVIRDEKDHDYTSYPVPMPMPIFDDGEGFQSIPFTAEWTPSTITSPVPMESGGEAIPYTPSPEMEAMTEIYGTFERQGKGREGFMISGNEITLYIWKDTPAAEVDALVGKIKERFPEKQVKIEK